MRGQSTRSLIACGHRGHVEIVDDDRATLRPEHLAPVGGAEPHRLGTPPAAHSSDRAREGVLVRRQAEDVELAKQRGPVRVLTDEVHVVDAQPRDVVLESLALRATDVAEPYERDLARCACRRATSRATCTNRSGPLRHSALPAPPTMNASSAIPASVAEPDGALAAR